MKIVKSFVRCPISEFPVAEWQFYQDKVGGNYVVGRSFLRCFFKYCWLWFKWKSWRLWFTGDPTEDLIISTWKDLQAIKKKMNLK